MNIFLFSITTLLLSIIFVNWDNIKPHNDRLTQWAIKNRANMAVYVISCGAIVGAVVWPWG